ncbi:hypothetical protein RND71_027958 [Anisodus tanguticus]|uniref:F-box protein n=1 Tax=Anisodus tanguticus TaxID=243964 RepID=A0AAE1RIX2_9SOLA|nr:hypothetical protein RND71_027958 [Anisodus tanguticus]
MSNLKKQKVGEDDGMSKLPDSLLVQILSLMPTTKDAFRTCIISKRWHYLWTFVDTFIFNITNHNTSENLSFVDYVLTHSVSPKIKKFELDCTDCTDMYSYDDSSIRCEYDSLVTRCLSFAVDRNVENVLLWSFEDDVCTLPESLCTCSSLITLDVKYCTFDYYHPVISWKSLKSIKFGYSVLYDDEIVNKLSGCPALETMELYNVEGSRRLEINSLILKRLKLKDYWFAHAGEDHFLEIFAPYLQHLEISGDLNDLKCRLLDVSSVVKAKLTFNIRCTKGDNDEESDDEEEEQEDNRHDYHQVLYTLVQDNLQKLSCAAELRIGTWFIEVLCMLQFEGVLIPELKCKYLTLELHVEKFNLCGAAGLLRASPHVETLDIDIAITPFDSSWCQFESGYLAKGDNLDLDIWISSFVFPNLKSVKIASSHGVCLKYHSDRGYVKKLFKLSQFLLKNASVLEKFVIVSKRRRCKTCSKNCVSRYLFQLAEKLSDCTRSSTNFMIIFQE